MKKFEKIILMTFSIFMALSLGTIFLYAKCEPFRNIMNSAVRMVEKKRNQVRSNSSQTQVSTGNYNSEALRTTNYSTDMEQYTVEGGDPQENAKTIIELVFPEKDGWDIAEGGRGELMEFFFAIPVGSDAMKMMDYGVPQEYTGNLGYTGFTITHSDHRMYTGTIKAMVGDNGVVLLNGTLFEGGTGREMNYEYTRVY